MAIPLVHGDKGTSNRTITEHISIDVIVCMYVSVGLLVILCYVKPLVCIDVIVH